MRKYLQNNLDLVSICYMSCKYLQTFCKKLREDFTLDLTLYFLQNVCKFIQATCKSLIVGKYFLTVLTLFLSLSGTQCTLGFWTEFPFNPLPIHTQGCYRCQKKRNFKGFLKSLVWCAVFHSELRKVWKTLKRHKKWLFFKTFFNFSPFWLKNSAPNQRFWNSLAIPLLLTPITSLGMDG